MTTEIIVKRVRRLNSFVSVIISWLERMVVVQTLPEIENEQDLQRSIQEIRDLLDDLPPPSP